MTVRRRRRARHGDQLLKNDRTGSRPRNIRTSRCSIAVSDEQVAELAVLAGFDDDLLGQTTAARNRMRGLLTQIHPALERAVGAYLHQIGVSRRWSPGRLRSG